MGGITSLIKIIAEGVVLPKKKMVFSMSACSPWITAYISVGGITAALRCSKYGFSRGQNQDTFLENSSAP
jgi:hypothetical protein